MNKKIKNRILRALIGEQYIIITVVYNSEEEANLNSRGLSPLQELGLLEDTYRSLYNDPGTKEYARALGEKIINEEFARIAADFGDEEEGGK